MRIPKFTPKKIEVHGKECWQINVPSDFSVTGKRSRPIFQTKSKAEAEAKKLRLNAAKFGSNLPTLPHDVHAEVLRVLKKLLPYKVSLEAAVDSFIERQSLLNDSITFSELVEQVLKAKESHGLSKKYLSDLKQKGNRFKLIFGDKKVCDITPKEIDDAIASLEVSPNSSRSYKRNLSVIFSMGVEWRYLLENPIKKVQREALPSREIEIFDVKQVQKLLKNASSEILPYYILGTFCGVRPKEILRLSWEDIDFERKTVEITAKNSKTNRRRFVDMESTAYAWLASFSGSEGMIVPKNFRAKFDADRKASGIFEEWSHDILRHSYASYHAAFYEDKQKTAYQLGHSDLEMLEKHYWRAVQRSDAELFWNLTPDQVLKATEGQPESAIAA